MPYKLGGTREAVNADLRKARVSCGKTQQDVAFAIGVDPRTYRRYEAGEAQPSLRTMRKLCELLKKTPQELGFNDGDCSCQQPPGVAHEDSIIVQHKAHVVVGVPLWKQSEYNTRI